MITTNGDLKQRGVNRRSDRQPPRIARLSPRRLIRAPDRGGIEMTQDLHVGILQRRRGLLDQRLDRRDADLV